MREQVSRMLASPDFLLPDRGRRFLVYIIEEALCGRADRIKALSIAADVLGRDSSFDGSTDPVVRIEAGRVRRALEHYYLTGGVNDPVVITIPKGGYVPCLYPAARHAADAEPAKPSPRRGVRLTAGGANCSGAPGRPCCSPWSRQSASWPI